MSGPAGGVVGAFYTAVQAGYTDIITVDMGGTSTDVSLCPGEIKETTSANIGGYPIGVPMIDIHTVGAGGGYHPAAHAVLVARLGFGGLVRRLAEAAADGERAFKTMGSNVGTAITSVEKVQHH